MEKMKFSTVVSDIQNYINQLGSAEIIEALSHSSESMKYFTVQDGVNEPTDIHMMECTGSFMDGVACDASANNTTFTYTDRRLTPVYVKQESIDCYNDLYGKWMAYNKRYGASTESQYPFAETMINLMQKRVNLNTEDLIWNGITIGGTTYSGITDIVNPSTAGVKVAYCSSTGTIYNQCVAAIKAADSRSRKETELYMNENEFLALKEELLAKDFRLFDLNYTNGAGEIEENTLRLPVYGTLVHAVTAIKDNDHNVYGLVNRHVVIGTSNDADRTDIQAISDDVHEKFILRAKMIYCVQVAYPWETVVALRQDAPTE